MQSARAHRELVRKLLTKSDVLEMLDSLLCSTYRIWPLFAVSAHALMKACDLSVSLTVQRVMHFLKKYAVFVSTSPQQDQGISKSLSWAMITTDIDVPCDIFVWPVQLILGLFYCI